MRGRTFAALGAGATAGAATVALITTGVVGASLSILVAPPFSSPAAAEELQPFDDCEQLRQWYVDAALPMVGPWGLGGPGYYMEGGAVDMRGSMALDDVAGAATPEAAVGSGDTGTNVQEAGVDEPDIAKTNGEIVVHLEGREVVLTDVSGDDPRELSRVTLPKLLDQAELLLVGDKVVVFGTETYYHGGPMTELDSRIMPPNGGGDSATKLVTIDISDPSAPRIEQQDRLGGRLVSAREYDGTVRLVLSTGLPALDFVFPNRDRTPQEARRENRQIVRDTGIESWLPSVRSGDSSSSDDDATPLVGCTDVLHPEEQSGFGTISVVTFDADSPADRSSTAVTAGGELVYSSMDRLYVATATGGWAVPMPLANMGQPVKPAPVTTTVHAFAIDGTGRRTGTEYVASGEVPGMVKDRWSFSEYDGHLRVATALGSDSWNPTENAVVVLEERGDKLVEVGRAGEMGIGEQIKSVRWFGDIAVVVTFLQVDPLYTVDLSDPTSPKVLGKLKIPGFSSYLHPLGNDLLLGMGQDADLSGMTTGAQAAVFDIGNLRNPKQLDTSGFDPNTELTVTWDTRAFTYLPEQRTAISPLQNYRWGGTRLAILKIGEDGTLTQRLTDRVAGWDGGTVRTLPLDDGRLAIVAGSGVELMAIG